MTNDNAQTNPQASSSSIITRPLIPLEAEVSPNSGGTSQPSQTQPSIAPESPGIRTGDNARKRRMEARVDEFRKGNCSKYDAITAILRELESEPLLSEEEKDSTFGLYCAEINSTETRSGTANRLPTVSRSAPEPDKGKATEDLSRGTIDLFDQLSKRSICDESDSEDEEGEKTHKKPKISEFEMPWNKNRKSLENGTSQSCIKTVKLLKLFNQDIKQSKFYISVAPGVPGNVPSSQWERILKGQPVDLDQILSSIHRITTVDEKKAKLGETEISLGAVEAAKKVTTYNEWSTAWRKTVRAITYVFAHRQQELEDYTEYIEGEFESLHTSIHDRIIHFDIAVRNLVCGGQQILLTDTHKFQRLYSANIHPQGIQNVPTSKKLSSTPGRREICNRFNNGDCRSSNCRYRHACKACGQTGHGKSTCTRKD